MTVSCGVDFHARQQTVAWCDTSDGEIHLEKLDHQDHNLIRSFYARSRARRDRRAGGERLQPVV